jgi:cytochrome P450
VGVFAEWHTILYNIKKYVHPSKGMSAMASFVGGQVAQRLEQNKVSEGTQDDFLGPCLKMHQEDPSNFTMEEVFLLCGINIGAGADSTAIALCGILYYLIKNPRVLQKVL